MPEPSAGPLRIALAQRNPTVGDIAGNCALVRAARAEAAETGADLIAAGNLGCIIQIGNGTDLPIVHTVELLDWAYGGPKPAHLDQV